MLLDDFMPVYHFSERHSTAVEAAPQKVFHAIREATFADSPLFSFLLKIRSLPVRMARGSGPVFLSSGSVFGWALGMGFVLLAEDASRELVFGRIGQFWKLFGGLSPRVANAQEFLAFNRPGFAKVTTNFYVDGSDGDGVKLSTETRIYVPDSVARRKFTAYWKLIHAGSALTRREWLRAVKRRAEQA